MEDILEVKNLKKYFPIRTGILRKHTGNVYAVDDVSFSVKEGETLGLVGESGCGKTTVGRTILHLYKPTEGKVIFEKKDIEKINSTELKKLRKDMQIVFQDPYESLNARHTVAAILEEPFIIHKLHNKKKRADTILNLLDLVGLPKSALQKFPHEFSGGQRQRIVIARAIALHPKLIICDEPVSALDVSIQSQVINLLLSLQKELSLTYIFISHDLTVVRHISDRVAVMYLGKIVEITDSESIYSEPLHPYTDALISAIPKPDPEIQDERVVLQGDVPSPIDPPSGCNFHTRCPHVEEICKQSAPELRSLASKERPGEHLVSCHLVEKIKGL